MPHERRNGVDLRRYRHIVEQAQRKLQRNLAGTQTPCYLEACIGREQELQAMERWLRQPTASLLTLVGPSGIGKTHLACEFLKRAQHMGIRSIYVNLTLLQSAEQIIPAVFHALNAPFLGDVWRMLAPRIFGQGVLLVLDDFDLLLPAGAQVVQSLIDAAPELKILATSQKPLDILEEATLSLSPLPTPPREWRGGSLESLRQNPSVAVFLAQAGESFQLTRSNAAQVARMCADLGGHPGKLVDAGLFQHRYSWSQFYPQYPTWFGLKPTGPLKPEAQRHRLYHMLREEEQRILQSLLVFPETFDGAAAAAAANIDGRLIEPFLDKLHHQGFLHTVHESARPLYRVRDHIRPIIPPLDEPKYAVVMQRLHAYYRQQLQPEAWVGRSGITPRAWCFAERFTLQRILDYLSKQGDLAAIAEMFQLLDALCQHRPPAMLLDWGVQYVNSTVSRSPEDCLGIVRAMLISLLSSGVYTLSDQLLEILAESDESAAILGRYWHDVGDGDRSYQFHVKALSYSERHSQREDFVRQAASLAESEAVIGDIERAEQILRELKSRYALYRMPIAIQSWYYYVAGYVQYQRGKFLRSRELYEVSLRYGVHVWDVQRELSRVYLELGDYEKAYNYATQTLRGLEDDCEPPLSSVYAVKSCLGDTHAVLGRYDEAFKQHAAALEFWRAQKQPRWICWTLNRLAEIELLAREEQHPWRLVNALGVNARACLEESWEVIEPTYKNLPHRSRTLHNLGWLAWHEGRLDEAEKCLNRALEIREGYGNRYGVARTLEALARVRASQERPHEAKELLRQASQIREQLDARPYPQIKQRNLSIWRRRG
ncbi:MAG: tetratricopeptide repeat protein [Fimbriimonadales bacterium]|nr:tetratricopeptide repeat protein [Fimbriimonadales bacterium]